MKKFIYFFALMCAFTIASCQDIEILETIETKETSPDFRIVKIIDGSQILSAEDAETRAEEGEYALQFPSESAYLSYINNLEGIDSKDILNKFEGTPFVSLQKIALIADQELEDLDAIATSEEDFLQRYSIYEKKYEGILIRNPYDDEDLQLYVPGGDDASTFLINCHKNIIIGNEIKTLSVGNNIDYSHMILSTNSNESQSTFGNTVINGSKKTTYRLRFHNGLEVHIGCQKKVWIGWKNDNHRDMYYALDMPRDYMSYTLDPLPGSSTYQKVPGLVTPCKYENSGKDHLTRIAGFIKAPLVSIVLSGEFYVWTDLTCDNSQSGYSNTGYDCYNNLYGGMSFPLLPMSTALGGHFTISSN